MFPIYYLIDPRFDYGRTISDAYGPAVANEYGWILKKDFDCVSSGAVVIDNRVTPESLADVKRFIDLSRIVIYLRIGDPFHQNKQHWWYKFVMKEIERKNIFLMSPYNPVEYLTVIWEAAQGRFVHAPYLYDEKKEIEINKNHERRKHRILITGRDEKNTYPLRASVKKLALLWPPLSRMIEKLEHPGYPDLLEPTSHSFVRSDYVSYLAGYKFVLVCGTRCNIEVQKYREIAYAGAVPIGKLSDSLVDCPADAWIPWRHNMPKLYSELNKCQSDTVANLFREYMRKKRNKLHISQSVRNQIIEHAQAIY